MLEMMCCGPEKVEEKVFDNPHREKGGFKARKARGEEIKKDMEEERVFSSLKFEQGTRSGRAEEEYMVPFHY